MTRDELERRLIAAGFERCGHPPLSGLARVVDEATGDFVLVITGLPGGGLHCARCSRRPGETPEERAVPYAGVPTARPFDPPVTPGRAWDFVREHLPPAERAHELGHEAYALRMAREFNAAFLEHVTSGDPAREEQARLRCAAFVAAIRREAAASPAGGPLFYADGVPVYRRDFERLVLYPGGNVGDARAWLRDRLAAYPSPGESGVTEKRRMTLEEKREAVLARRVRQIRHRAEHSTSWEEELRRLLLRGVVGIVGWSEESLDDSLAAEECDR